MEKKDLPNAQFYLLVVYGLTNDPEIKELLEKISPKKKEQKPEPDRSEKIQQTK